MVDLELYQCSIFDELFEKKVITKKIRLIELFSGIGAQAKALEILNIPFEHYLTCEWAYNSIVGYNAIHIKDKTDYAKDMSKEQLLSYLNGNISIDYNKPADLTKKPIEWLKNCYNNVIATHDLMNIMNVKGRDLGVFDRDYEYILTYSFPCQDLSLAGKRSGMETSQSEGGTRSGLLWEVERILLERKRENLDLPSILLMENVPEVVGTKNDNHFYKWCNQLSKLGYQNYFKILNAKNYGIPQNRKRCFMISILGDYTYDFPKKLALKHKLKDLLDKNVDEKYYLSKKMFNYLTGINQKESKYDRGSVFERNFNPKKEIASTITTAAGQRATDNFVVEEYSNKRLNETIESNNVKDGDFIDAYNKVVNSEVAGTITTRVSDSNCTFIAKKENDNVCDALGVNIVDLKRGYSCEIKEEKEDVEGVEIIGNYSKSNFNQTSIVNKNGIAPTITENHGQVTAIAIKNNTKQGYSLAEEGDGVDISGRMQYHRGTVQKETCQTLTTGGDNVGVVVKEKNNCWSEMQIKMITDEGNVKRYIGSEQIDKFEEGQAAYLDYPTGYGHGTRVSDNCFTLCAKNSSPIAVKNELRIRKLTPCECIKLMGFERKDYESLVEYGLSDSAIYHCAGDSIVATVVVGLFGTMTNKDYEQIIKDYVERIAND